MAKVGDIIGNYRLVEKIACGSYGCVYRAEHRFLKNRVVALKLMHNAHINSQEDQNHYLEEANLLGTLTHPYILSIIDAGIDEDFPYMVTEYAPNGSLKSRLQRQHQQPLPTAETITILSQIGQALQYAHQQNIIHRDLKPENILFNAKGEALIADFGIATVLASGRTKLGDIGGTPSYMAPEQFEGTISAKSDQYSLGCIAYELFTGRRPFIIPRYRGKLKTRH